MASSPSRCIGLLEPLCSLSDDGVAREAALGLAASKWLGDGGDELERCDRGVVSPSGLLFAFATLVSGLSWAMQPSSELLADDRTFSLLSNSADDCIAFCAAPMSMTKSRNGGDCEDENGTARPLSNDKLHRCGVGISALRKLVPCPLGECEADLS